MIRLSGIDSAAIRVARRLLRNSSRMSDAQQAADDDGVADVGDRRADQQALVVDRDGSRRRAGRLLAASASTSSRACETASALPPSRRKTVSATASLPLERIAIVRSSCPIVTRPRSRSRIDWPFFSAMTTVFQVERVGRQRVGQHLVLQRPAVEPADGLEPVLLAQAVGHVGDREVGRHQGLGLDLDEDLADVAPLDRDVGDVRDAADPGPQVVIGVVVQRRRVAAAGDDERDDREDRRGLPLGDRGGARRELRPDLGHAGADVVERLDHVGAGGEVDRQLGGPADRLRADPDHAQHDARRPPRSAG